jgi:hypothetical protein
LNNKPGPWLSDAECFHELLSFVELSCGVFEGLNGVLFGTEYQRKVPFRLVNCAMVWRTSP